MSSHGAWHGRCAEGAAWPAPIKTSSATADSRHARPGFSAVKSSEYADSHEVLKEKAALLASLLRSARCCVAYTGAGLSTSAGIDDYATRDAATLAARPAVHPYDAQPSPAHFVLARLGRAGLLAGGWVQQNHDGLPQKAGYPQAAINEIHGSWFDPSNPVVPMAGELRRDLFEALLERCGDGSAGGAADLVLVLGTSLAGMNADRIVESVARRAASGGALGAVIVGLQATPLDADAQLRVFARTDDFMALLAAALALPDEVAVAAGDAACDAAAPREGAGAAAPASPGPAVEAGAAGRDVFLVPYDAAGRRLPPPRPWARGSPPPPPPAFLRLDLSEGALVRITAGRFAGDVAEVVGRTRGGHWRLQATSTVNARTGFKAKHMLMLGSWWAAEAATGAVPLLPVVPVQE